MMCTIKVGDDETFYLDIPQHIGTNRLFTVVIINSVGEPEFLGGSDAASKKGKKEWTRKTFYFQHLTL